MVQFGMWLLRPRVVREFRGWRDTLAQAEPFFLPIMQAVDRVHKVSILEQFWRDGELISNPTADHPYQVNVPVEYRNETRWFLLNTSLDPPRPWKLNTELPVFALALARGRAPSREWLVYAHSPLAPRTGVSITIPAYGPIRAEVPVTGAFYLVSEQNRQVKAL
jgi:hypothetical protein